MYANNLNYSGEQVKTDRLTMIQYEGEKQVPSDRICSDRDPAQTRGYLDTRKRN
jgi:hypothetical protein